MVILDLAGCFEGKARLLAKLSKALLSQRSHQPPYAKSPAASWQKEFPFQSQSVEEWVQEPFSFFPLSPRPLTPPLLPLGPYPTSFFLLHPPPSYSPPSSLVLGIALMAFTLSYISDLLMIYY